MGKIISLFIFSCAILISGCSSPSAPLGKATVTGKFTGSIPSKETGESIIITLSVPNPILWEKIEYETQLKDDGTFAFTVPLVSPAYAPVSIALEEYSGAIFLSPGKNTELEVFFDEAGETHIRMTEGKGLTREDIEKIEEVSMEVLEAIQDNRNSPRLQLNTSPNVFRDSIIVNMEKDLSIVKNSNKLQEESKLLLYNTLKLFYLNYFLLDYESQMHLLYLNQHLGEKVNSKDFIG